MIKFRAEYENCIYTITKINFEKEEAVGKLSGLNIGSSEIQHFSFDELEVSLDNGINWESFVNFNNNKNNLER